MGPRQPATMLEVRNLAKRFGSNLAVDGVSFRIEAGEAYGLLGPNGAGKSTTISLILGLLAPDAGTVEVDGLSLARQPNRARAAVGFVPQEIALYPTLSARENLAFWGRMYHLAGKDLARRIGAVLETVGLADRGKDRVATFSGGMKRRVNIAAALLHSPKLLIMDEPTVGIDPQSRTHILETVKALNASGLTILYTSHYMEEVEYLCARTGVIDHGKLIAEGTLSELRRVVGERSLIHLRLTEEGAGGADAAALRAAVAGRLNALPGVLEVTSSDGEILIATLDPAAVLPLVTAEAGLAGRIRSVSLQEPNLEAVFLHLTGRALRD